MIFQIPAFDVVTLPSLPTLDRRTSENGNADPHARAPVACPALRRAGCAVSYTLPADQAGGRVLVLLDMLWLGHDATPASRRPPRGSGAAAPSGALRAIDASARPRRLRRQSDGWQIATQGGSA